MRFLGDVARLALEGSHGRAAYAAAPSTDTGSRTSKDRPGRGRRRRIRAAVPDRAATILDRLTGVRTPFESLESLAGELELAAARPMEVTIARRGVHLLIQGIFLLPGLLLIFFLSGGIFPPGTFPGELETVIAIPILWGFWGMMTRGGWSLSLAGINLVHHDGRRAGRRASGVRALLVWALPTLLLAGSRYVQAVWPEEIGLALSLWFGALMLLVLEITLGLLFPRCGLHDWLAKTELVPF
jgi:hypothetical protein